MKVKQLLIKFTPYVFPLIFFFLGIVLSLKNYSPGTWLSGWDTLHPEFDFALNFKRVLFGVWREEQGVGAIAAHSHMSEIPRILFLWLSSVVLHQNFLRYFFFFVTLTLGPLGVYFFLKRVFKGRGGLISSLTPFLGGLYYLLNLGTLQHYYVPFEMFAIQYAVLGWIFLFVVNFINEGKKKDILAIFLVSFLAAGQAYASTLFYAYLGSLILFLFGLGLLNRERTQKIKRSLVIMAVIFITNSFWLLPNIYSLAKQSKTIESSRINVLFSPEAFLRNKDWGTLPNILTHKNFLFSWREYDEKSGQFVDLLDEWNSYLSKPYIGAIGTLMATIFVLGLALAIFRRDKIGLSLLLPTGFCLFFLINENPPTGFIYSFLRDHIDAFKEAFRTPFTKVSIIFMFSAAYYFAFFFQEFFELMKRRKILVSLSWLGTLAIAGMLVLYMLPAFRGNLISPSMRIKIPQEYFELANYVSKQNSTARIAKFPVNTMWGWIYYDWGYEGAGFNWFDIKNPTFDRDFDRWSSFNETFYNQVSEAIYSQDLNALEGVLEKFQVGYLLIDRSVVNPGGSQALTYTKETIDIFAKSSHIKKERDFGVLSLYRTDFDLSSSLVSAPQTYLKISGDLTYSTKDPIYEKFKTYVSWGQGDIYPFVNFDKRKAPEVTFENDSVHLVQAVGVDLSDKKTLILPDYPKNEGSILVQVNLKEQSKGNYAVSFLNRTPEVFINGAKKAGGNYLWQEHPIKSISGRPDYISIGDRVFGLGGVDLKKAESPLGVVLLDTQQTIPVRLYSGNKKEVKDEVKRIYQTQPRWCSDPQKTLPIETIGGEYALNVEKNSLCWGTGFYFSEEALLSISFESKSTTGLYPKFCLGKAGKEGCVNSSTPTTFTRGDWSQSGYLVPVDVGDYFLDFVAQGQEAGQGKIAYRNLQISTLGKVGAGAYSVGENFALVSQEDKVDVFGPIEKIEVSFPLYKVVKEEIGLGRGHPQAANCDLKKVGEVSKQNLGISLRYRAQNGGVSCDYFDYLSLDYSQGYLFRIVGKNSLGRSLKAYLQNRVSGRMDLEELLPAGEFDEKYFILPKTFPGEGYVFNFETRSFGNVASENSLSGVEIIHFPYNWLSNLRLEGRDSQVVSGLNISSVAKLGTAYYRIGYTGQGLLTLGQGYEDGWLAMANGKRLPHVKVNSWANGWLLPQQSTVNGQQSTVIIIFWPQLLEFLGFGLLLVGLGFLLVSKKQLVDPFDNTQVIDSGVAQTRGGHGGRIIMPSEVGEVEPLTKAGQGK